MSTLSFESRISGCLVLWLFKNITSPIVIFQVDPVCILLFSQEYLLDKTSSDYRLSEGFFSFLVENMVSILFTS